MSADHLLCQMEQDLSNEWFDFDNSFEFLSGYLDSDPSAVNSISPEDYALPFPDLDPSWDLASGLCSLPDFPDTANHDSPIENALENTAEVADLFGHSSSADPGLFGLTTDFDTTCGFQEVIQPVDWASSIRHMVEAQATADPSCLSAKVKRRDASIAIHLQRLQACQADSEISSDSNTSFASPWTDFLGDSNAPKPAQAGSAFTSAISTDRSVSTSPEPDASGRGVELVLDLNMNAPANLPKKQKPRSQAQKDNYIKARKYGACEKHRKQHKRCNCLDKDASHQINLHGALAAATTQSESSKPQKLQIRSVQPGMSSAQSIASPKNPFAGSAPAHAGTPGCIHSNQPTPSLEGRVRRPRPSTRKSVASGNPAPPGLQPCQQFKATQPRHAAAGQTPSVPEALPNQSTSVRLPRPVQTDGGSCGSVNVSPAGRRCDPTPRTQTSCQSSGRFATRAPTRPETLHVGLLPTSRRNLPQIHPENVGQAAVRYLTEYAAAAVLWPLVAFSSFWKASSTTSLVGLSIGRSVLACCKWHFAAKKRLELFL